MKKLLSIILIAILIVSCQKPPKTAFVKTEKIFKEYKGIKDQEKIFKQKQEAFSKKYDSLVKKWRQDVNDFQSKMRKMSPKKAQQMDQKLYQQQQILQQMQQQEGAKLTSEMQAKTDSIIKKVYSFFDDYGKKNGYEYIFGKNTSGGSMMYGKADKDITDAVLKALDAEYEKK